MNTETKEFHVKCWADNYFETIEIAATYEEAESILKNLLKANNELGDDWIITTITL